MDAYTRLLLVQFVGIITAGNLVYGANEYYPLDPKEYSGYKTSGWSLYLTEGAVSVATADYKRCDKLDGCLSGLTGKPTSTSAPCVRVVVFMAHGAVLDKLESDCNAIEHSAGLFTRNSALRYYDAAALRQEATGRYVLIKKTEDGKCSRKTFVLGECTDKCPSPRVKDTEDSSDKSCKELDDSPIPPMLLLPSKGGVGVYKADTEWFTYNPLETLGFATREYQHKHTCFRLFVVTSKGRGVHAVKLTCGPVSGVSSSGTFLQLRDTLYATVAAPDKFTVLLNTRDGNCVKRTISLEEKDGSVVRNPLPDSKLTAQDKDCHRLVSSEVAGSVVSKEKVIRFKTTPLQDVLEKELPKLYAPAGRILDYNTAMAMGLLVQNFTKTDDNKQKHITIVTAVARGVHVFPVVVEAGTPKQIIAQDTKVYYGKDIAFTKLYAKDGYQVLSRIDEGRCSRKLFTVKEDGFRKEFTAIKPEVNILDDKECKNLIEGAHLKGYEELRLNDMEKL